MVSLDERIAHRIGALRSSMVAAGTDKAEIERATESLRDELHSWAIAECKRKADEAPAAIPPGEVQLLTESLGIVDVEACLAEDARTVIVFGITNDENELYATSYMAALPIHEREFDQLVWCSLPHSSWRRLW